jgi:hypothetical protein
MKKVFLGFLILAVVCFSTFSNNEDQEEVDFLIFLPNSSNQFTDEEQAMEHLDSVAKYLLGRNLISGQVHVDGYAAYAANDVEPENLSRDRALFVIGELKKRGVPEYLFADPAAFGSVDLWGSNVNENERSQNRRVRIILDGDILTSGILEASRPQNYYEKAVSDNSKNNAKDYTNILILFLLLLILALIAGLILCAIKCRKKTKTAEKGYSIINLDEEIRRRAYELYLERNGENGDDYTDWCNAVNEICCRYESANYHTYYNDQSWLARSKLLKYKQV